MPPTDAMIGYGSKYEVSTDGGTTWTEIAEAFNITPPSDSVDFVEATNFQSPNATKEFLLALRDPGEASLEQNFIPGSPTDLLLQQIRASRTTVQNRITFPNGVIWTFTGLLTSYAPTTPLEDRMTATLTWKITGSTVVSAEVAPTNVTLPAISGIAQEDEVLTALPGIWTGAPIFTYQWKLDDVDISLATGPTYTVVTGDIGGAITVEVTGTNTAGNASATSAATADVISA